MPSPNKEQVLALSGLLQSGVLVYQLSRGRNWDHNALHESTYSLLKIQADSVMAVYGDVYGLSAGLSCMAENFSAGSGNKVREVYRYAASCHQLSLKLGKLKYTSEIVQTELETLSLEFGPFSATTKKDAELQSRLADLYTRRISYLSPRIIVRGSSENLSDNETVNRIRTALFAGIRAGFLWHQLGGRRWHLLFNRKHYIAGAVRILHNPS